MACYMNNCGCANCPSYVKSTNIAIVDDQLQITIPTMTYANDAHVCICLVQPIPAGVTADIPVVIVNGTETYELRYRNGNTVYADAVRSRKLLCTTFAIDNAIFVVQNCALRRTAHVYTAPAADGGGA